jgi:predicted nucleotidyltransferase
MPSDGTISDLLDAMKQVAAVLRDNEVEFALAGGQAIYAYGGPESGHDVDFLLREPDAERALHLLGDAGFRCERPPEHWLYKVYDDKGAMIDLIFAPNNRPETVDDQLARAQELEVYAVMVKVMSVTDVLATKLLALKEHEVDYESVLEVTRALRERVDWPLLRELTEGNPYAQAYFTLCEELGLT